MSKIILNQKDFIFFQNKVKFWIKRLGLTDWQVYFEFEKLEENDFAQIKWNYKGSKATMYLNQEWRNVPKFLNKEHQLEQTALHEVLHLLLARLNAWANDRKWDELEYEAEEHRVIHQIMQVLLEKD